MFHVPIRTISGSLIPLLYSILRYFNTKKPARLLKPSPSMAHKEVI
jgi:hypothetical protein